MTRAIITIRNQHDRDRAKHWIDGAPLEMRIEFKAAKRTGAQNDLMWALLSEVAAQVKHAERKYTAEQWKVLFLHGMGREVQFIPALDNSTFIPLGASSSDLSKAEMSDLIEFIYAWGAEHGVKFSDPDSSDASVACVRTDGPATGNGPASTSAVAGTLSSSSDGSAANDRTKPAGSGPQPVNPAGTFLEATLLSDDWRDVYIVALSGIRDKAASLLTRHTEAMQMLGGQPNFAELVWMRKAWRLVQRRNENQLKLGEYHALLAELMAMPLPAVRDTA